jgi:prolyl oligopeptidase
VAQVVKLVDNWEAQYEYITNEGTLFWFKTNLKAPKNKLITIDLTRPDEARLPATATTMGRVGLTRARVVWCVVRA